MRQRAKPSRSVWLTKNNIYILVVKGVKELKELRQMLFSKKNREDIRL